MESTCRGWRRTSRVGAQVSDSAFRAASALSCLGISSSCKTKPSFQGEMLLKIISMYRSGCFLFFFFPQALHKTFHRYFVI